MGRFKLLLSLGNNMPITGIAYERFPGDSSKYFVLAVTPTRLYHFTGSPNFEALFAKYEVFLSFSCSASDFSEYFCHFLIFIAGLMNLVKWFCPL
jgi:hypothetical protein